MPKQLPKISILRTRYPDLPKVIFPQQPKQQQGIPAVGLLLFLPALFLISAGSPIHNSIPVQCQQALEPA